MKTLKIYNIIATLIIIGLSLWVIYLLKELQETNEILEQCTSRYYKEIGK